MLILAGLFLSASGVLCGPRAKPTRVVIECLPVQLVSGSPFLQSGSSGSQSAPPTSTRQPSPSPQSTSSPQLPPPGASSSSSQGARTQKPGSAAADPGSALDFLGSYSAPQAVLATETGHTSSRPPSAAADLRLRELASDLGRVPASPGEARRWLIETLASPKLSPEEWFRAGTVALGAARADSRRLAEVAPTGVWNRRLEAEALVARYPLIARSLWTGNPAGSKAVLPHAPGQVESLPSHSTPSSPSPSVQRAEQWAGLRAGLGRLDKVAESEEVLYRRTRILIGISEFAYQEASESPALDARLFALQALAAEEENDEAAALDEYRRGLAKYSESALLHAGLGHLYRERNQLDLARSELEQAWRLDSTDALVAFDLGDVEQRTGDSARAAEMLNRALSIDPGLLVARWARARAYLNLGGVDNEQRALADLEVAVPCDRSGVLQWQLAQLYTKLGRSREAREAEQRSQDQRRAAERTKHPAVARRPA